jgi:hypothetical protein
MSSLVHRSLLGLFLVVGVGAPACTSDGNPPPAARAPDDGDDDEKADSASTGGSDAGSASASRKDAGATQNRDAGKIDAGAAKDAAIVEPPVKDAATTPSDAAVVADAQTPGPTSNGPTGTLPAVTDLAKPGPYTPATGPGPSGYVLFYPKELGKDGVKHPIVTWGPGAAETASSFTTLLKHFASHGFAVISYDGTPDGQELVKGVDYMVAENGRDGSMFFGKLDTTKVSSGGHSAGSLATFKIAADKRLTTTMHLCGGTFDPHTDIKNLHAPALFICGDSGGDGLISGDVARPNCDIDFMNVTVPVFYGNPKGAAHMSPTEIGDATLRSKFAAACVGWLRWQLAGDETQKSMFIGASCTLCKDTSWTTQQKNW